MMAIDCGSTNCNGVLESIILSEYINTSEKDILSSAPNWDQWGNMEHGPGSWGQTSTATPRINRGKPLSDFQ